MGLNLSRCSPGAWRKDPRPSVKGCKDRAKAPGKPVCVCVDSLVLWTANTAHKGVLKITSVMCILRWRERDNLWGWWVMGKEKKALKDEKWKTRISMVSPALPCTEHLLWSLDIENGKGYLGWKESLRDPLFFFFLPVFYGISGP